MKRPYIRGPYKRAPVYSVVGPYHISRLRGIKLRDENFKLEHKQNKMNFLNLHAWLVPKFFP